MQNVLTPLPYRPTSALSGSERATYRAQNLKLRGGNGSPLYFESYRGHLNLNEPIPATALTGTISFTAGSTAITGAGTDFLGQLHVGQLIQANGQPFVVKSITSDTAFTAANEALITLSGQTAYRLPVLFPLDVKRGSLLTGNALHYDKGTILAVGSGVLYVNGAVLQGDSLTASRSAQVALYDATTGNYDVQPIGFDDIPTAPTVTVVTGSSKSMALGFYSFRVAYYSDITSGYGNPTDPILDTGGIGFEITAFDDMFEFDFAADTPPDKATGYIIYATIYGGSSDISSVSAVEGAWFELQRVPFTSLVGDKVNIAYVDSDLSATVASFNNDMPPDAEFYASLDRFPFLISTDGRGVNETGRQTTTSPGPYVSPIKADNFDAYPAGSKVPTEKGENIIGAVSSAGRIFVLTSNTLQAVTPTGLPDAPFTCRPFWQRGFSNPYNVCFIDDTIYGFSGTSVFRSIASGDTGQESQDFASDVEDQLAQMSPSFVYLAYDPLNAELCLVHTCSRQNDYGFWESDIYPYSLRKYGWQPPCVLESNTRDMIVSGLATVNGHMEFIAGGRDSQYVALVAGAGTAAANGTYTERGTSGGKRYYNLFGQADSTANYCIKWTGTAWVITSNAGATYYTSSDAVDFPWEVTTWTLGTGVNPVPTVTESEIVVVSGAGTGAANGSYSKRGTTGGKPYYNLTSQSASTTNYCIKWNGTAWVITSNTGTTYYTGTGATVRPYYGVTWVATTGVVPVPSVLVGFYERCDTWRYDVDSGEDVEWYASWTYSDSGIETTPKVIKNPRIKGRFSTSPTISVYTVSPASIIDVDGLETGATPDYSYTVDDSALVTQYPIKKANIRNALMWTFRVNGIRDGASDPDQLHEIAVDIGVTGQQR